MPGVGVLFSSARGSKARLPTPLSTTGSDVSTSRTAAASVPCQSAAPNIARVITVIARKRNSCPASISVRSTARQPSTAWAALRAMVAT